MHVMKLWSTVKGHPPGAKNSMDGKKQLVQDASLVTESIQHVIEDEANMVAAQGGRGGWHG